MERILRGKYLVRKSKLKNGAYDRTYQPIILSDVEEPKQETLELPVEINFANEIEQISEYDKGRWYGRVEGVKWQQERTFSFNSNFIPSIIEKYLETAFISKEQGYMNPKEWLEKFKKK